MTKPKILIQLDTDPQPSVFDAVVAIDAGVDHLLQYGSVTPENVEGLVHGAMFTRGPADLSQTAIFVGGSNVSAGEALLKRIAKCFFGPLRVSVLLDANGANTTAAAAVLAAAKHVDLKGATATVLAGTGPVGQRAARLLAGRGCKVRIGSRSLSKAEAVRAAIVAQFADADVSCVSTATSEQTAAAIDGSQIVIAAGAAGVELLSEDARRSANSLRVAIDLNAVPPVGISGVQPMDKGAEQAGVICYGALGVGGTKMKIHRAAIQRLFTANSHLLDAEEVLQIGEELTK